MSDLWVADPKTAESPDEKRMWIVFVFALIAVVGIMGLDGRCHVLQETFGLEWVTSLLSGARQQFQY